LRIEVAFNDRPRLGGEGQRRRKGRCGGDGQDQSTQAYIP
jgi:hypothetical protein